MLTVNNFVLLCLVLNSRQVDAAETNNCIIWPSADNHRHRYHVNSYLLTPLTL